MATDIIHRAGLARTSRNNCAADSSKAPSRATLYGLPCAVCNLYYPAAVSECPNCGCSERVSPNLAPVLQCARF